MTDVPDPVDTAAASILVAVFGESADAHTTGALWAAGAAAAGTPCRVLTLRSSCDDEDRAAWDRALADSRVGVRIMVTGGQYDVLVAQTMARDRGALAAELTTFVVVVDAVPVYCVHCRVTYRSESAPGEQTQCPTCARRLEVHNHFASARGSFLATEVDRDEARQ